MSNGRPTEVTALLDSSQAVQSESLPQIAPTVARLRTLEVHHIRSEDVCPYTFPSRSADTAFSLIVLLELRASRLRRRIPSRDVWEHWSRDTDNHNEILEQQLNTLWTLFLQEYRSPREIEDALWIEFPVDEGSLRTVRGMFIHIYFANLF